MPDDIGRARAFTPGWLENGSIWLHMEYKYLLELIKNGLYEEFHNEMKNCLTSFARKIDDKWNEKMGNKLKTVNGGVHRNETRMTLTHRFEFCLWS
ncbi:MAG: hypothetical protein ACOC4G_00315 [Bacillota bacterium]